MEHRNFLNKVSILGAAALFFLYQSLGGPSDFTNTSNKQGPPTYRTIDDYAVEQVANKEVNPSRDYTYEQWGKPETNFSKSFNTPDDDPEIPTYQFVSKKLVEQYKDKTTNEALVDYADGLPTLTGITYKNWNGTLKEAEEDGLDAVLFFIHHPKYDIPLEALLARNVEEIANGSLKVYHTELTQAMHDENGIAGVPGFVLYMQNHPLGRGGMDERTNPSDMLLGSIGKYNYKNAEYFNNIMNFWIQSSINPEETDTVWTYDGNNEPTKHPLEEIDL